MVLQWSIIISMDAFKWWFSPLNFLSISKGKLLRRNEWGYAQLLCSSQTDALHDLKFHTLESFKYAVLYLIMCINLLHGADESSYYYYCKRNQIWTLICDGFFKRDGFLWKSVLFCLSNFVHYWNVKCCRIKKHTIQQL